MDIHTNVLSLFAGIGGLDLGVRRAVRGARTVCYIEREIFSVEVLVRAFAAKQLDAAPIWSDVTTFDGIAWRGIVDILIAGFPCQDISSIGRGAGIEGGKKSGLWYEVARIAEECQPRWIFLENVANINTRGLDSVLRSLAEIGYDAEWVTIPATDAGATTRRGRWFCLAHTNRYSSTPGKYGDVLSTIDETGLSSGSVYRHEDTSSVPSDWPPGPCEFERWIDTIRDRPDLVPGYHQSEVCGMAARVSDWVDRVRSLGNTVIPAQAEYAFRLLYSRYFPDASHHRV